MINKFLKAKHWQLFFLTFGILMISQFIMMGMMISNRDIDVESNHIMMLSYMKVFVVLTIVFAGVFLGWFWSVGVGLQSRIPKGVKMKVKRFKIGFIIPALYMLIFMVFLLLTLNGEMDVGNRPSGILFGKFAVIIIPLHLFSMFCLFHSLYFVAKTFKTVELQREVTFSDFAGEFFLIWFYPIGVWIIQPKINKMVEEEITNLDEEIHQ
jgi:hypothetical protein